MSEKLQQLINKNYKTCINNTEELINILSIGDIELISYFYKKIMSENDIKLHILQKLITSPNTKIKNVIQFFKLLTPLNVEYNFGFTDWNFKFVNDCVLIQNSVLRNNHCILLYRLYLEPIKNILTNSNIDYKMYTFKNRRAYKQIDIIFCIKL